MTKLNLSSIKTQNENILRKVCNVIKNIKIESIDHMLGKEHSFRINPMIKGSNGEYQPAEHSCVIEPKEKHIPWWKKLFNLLFGKRKKANQKVGFDALVSEEQASDIFDLDTEIKDYTDKVRPLLDRDNEHSEFIKKIDMYALGPYTNNEPNEFFKKNSGIVSSMDRMPSRASLIIGNMLNDGFTYEDLLEPNENTINHLKEVGKRFLDTMAMTDEKVLAASLDAEFESKSADECFEQHKRLNSTKTKKPIERAIGK